MKTEQFKFTDSLGLDLTIEITITEDKITHWELFQNGNEVDISDGYIMEEYSDDFIKTFPDVFSPIDLERYGHSATATGIVYKPTKQVIGYDGYYSSWDGTTWDNKFIGDMVEVVRVECNNMKAI